MHDSHRSTDPETPVRRLAAELGLSQQLQGDSRNANALSSSPLPGARESDSNDDFNIDEDAKTDSPWTPLRSESISESLSSDLSLPLSLKAFPSNRRPQFDDQLQSPAPRSASVASLPSPMSGVSSNEMMRKFYEAQVAKTRKQLTVVTQSHRKLEHALQEERQMFQSKLTAMEVRFTVEANDETRELMFLEIGDATERASGAGTRDGSDPEGCSTVA